jgi:hypothetical protein
MGVIGGSTGGTRAKGAIGSFIALVAVAGVKGVALAVTIAQVSARATHERHKAAHETHQNEIWSHYNKYFGSLFPERCATPRDLPARIARIRVNLGALVRSRGVHVEI